MLVAYFLDSVFQDDVLEIIIFNFSLIFSYVRFNSVLNLHNIQKHLDEQNFDIVDLIIQINWFYRDNYIPLSLYDVVSFFKLGKALNAFSFFFLVSYIDIYAELLIDDDLERLVLLILSDFDVFENRDFKRTAGSLTSLLNMSFCFKAMRRSIESIRY